jgi:hypothetical protein
MLMVEGLTMIFNDANRREVVKGVKISNLVLISCLLSVDNIIIFYQGSIT